MFSVSWFSISTSMHHACERVANWNNLSFIATLRRMSTTEELCRRVLYECRQTVNVIVRARRVLREGEPR